MKTPVCDFVNEYTSGEPVRLHMPGHKGKSITGVEAKDITEIHGSGELYTSEGPVGEGEAVTASLFGSAKTCWGTEGSSQCIRAMLALAALGKKGTTILAARNVHRSFLTACALLDLKVEWLFPEDYSLCACPVSPDQVREKLGSMEEPPIALYLTSPDYLGGLQDIQGIATVCHSHGLPLLVDNAHGAYLKFLTPSRHPMDLGADLCCDSAHKTLPCLTGCAYLHISKNAPEIFQKEAKRMLSLFGSTSPSWLALQSLDAANGILAGDYREKLKNCIRMAEDLKKDLEALGWQFYGEEPTKLTLDAKAAGYRGEELADLLREDKIECEYADPDYLVWMLTPWTEESDLDRVRTAFGKISPKAARGGLKGTFPKAIQAFSIREAVMSEAEKIPALESAGRVIADSGIACPPAVAVLTAGERIEEEHIQILKYYGITEVTVMKE